MKVVGTKVLSYVLHEWAHKDWITDIAPTAAEKKTLIMVNQDVHGLSYLRWRCFSWDSDDCLGQTHESNQPVRDAAE